MAIAPVNVAPQVKKKRGGGLFGKILGGLAGGIAAAATGGAALPAIGAGMAIGGTAGSAIKPGSATQTGGRGLAQVADQDNEVMLARTNEAIKELQATTAIPEPEKEQYLNPLMQTQGILKKKIKPMEVA